MPMFKPEKGVIRTVTSQWINETEFAPPRIEVPFHFNPPEVQLTFKNNWTVPDSPKNKQGRNLEYAGGEPRNVTLELLFDTYELNNPRESLGASPATAPRDVREITDKLVAIMQPCVGVGDHKQPAAVEVEWGHLKKGEALTFTAHIVSLTQKFILFMPDGMPVRAVVTLVLQEYFVKKRTAQNPTSGSLGSERTRLVKPGERLDLIAHEEYGDSSLWRVIADANGLLSIRHLTVGQRLAIPQLR
jgi:nucleoid-associated protein YgaU